jgi:hypothetical protein
VVDVGYEVFLPPTYVLRRRPLEAVLNSLAPDARNVTVWIHSSTLGIEKQCFHGMLVDRMKHVSRIRVCDAEPHCVERPAVLGMLITNLRAYEPDLVDLIHAFVTHASNEAHHVGENAFCSCSVLKEVVLPRSITHVDRWAFWRCTSLTLVELPNTLTHVGDSAFRSCTSLTSVALLDSVTHVGDNAFRECSALTSVTLPNLLTHVGEGSFHGCISLKSVTLPASLQHIRSDNLFQGTTIVFRSAAD